MSRSYLRSLLCLLAGLSLSLAACGDEVFHTQLLSEDAEVGYAVRSLVPALDDAVVALAQVLVPLG